MALFDLDGTLIDSPLDFGAMRHALFARIRDLALDSAQFEGLDLLEVIEKADRTLETEVNWRSDADALIMEFERAAARSAREIEGARSMLLAMRRSGRRVGIVTRNCRAAVEIAMTRIPLPCDLLLTRNDVPRVKPHPDHLLRAARALGAPPERCIMCGDHAMDVRAARAAAMYSVAVVGPRGAPETLMAAGPDLLLPCLRDLTQWI